MFVTKRSSPTSCTASPRRSVSVFQPAQSSSAMPSSIERTVKRADQVGPVLGELVAGAELRPSPSWYRAVVCRARSPPGRGRSRRPRPACTRPPRCRPRAGPALLRWSRGRARSRPRRRRWSRPRSCRRPFSAWKISAPARSASGRVGAPTGTIMNSWRSTLLSAWAPPLSTFIIGTGSTRAASPPRVSGQSGTSGPRPPRVATASETPRIALAPRRDLFGVPSSSISAPSRPLLVRRRRGRRPPRRSRH